MTFDSQKDSIGVIKWLYVFQNSFKGIVIHPLHHHFLQSRVGPQALTASSSAIQKIQHAATAFSTMFGEGRLQMLATSNFSNVVMVQQTVIRTRMLAHFSPTYHTKMLARFAAAFFTYPSDITSRTNIFTFLKLLFFLQKIKIYKSLIKLMTQSF